MPRRLGSLIVLTLLSPLPAAPAAAAPPELLAEHISDYSSSPSSDLPGCASTTASLYNEFGDAGGWSRTWWANSTAWEQDFKSSHLAGGDDDDWSDAVDFSYFCGHGNVGLVEFTTNKPGKILNNSETRWGNGDAEWVTLDTSMTLRDTGSNLNTWYFNAFAKLHLLVGWHDSPIDGDTGGEYADSLIDWGFADGGGDDITTSWFAGSGGCTDQSGGTTQTILAEIKAHYSDHVPGQGSAAADSNNNGIYWVWKHDC